MIEDLNFETYLRISTNKYGIYLIDKNNFKNLYQSEITRDDDFLNYDVLNQFLDNNIFKIEKFVGKFIKNIYVIIEDNEINEVNIGIKKKNYNEITNTNYLENTLVETKDLFKKHYQNQIIMHMVISNHLINGKVYSRFEKDLKIQELCLVINFISISKNFSQQIEKILEKYQIRTAKYLNEQYVKSFFKDQNILFSQMIYKILNGFNENEVQLVAKNKENKGLFEKFFQLFS